MVRLPSAAAIADDDTLPLATWDNERRASSFCSRTASRRREPSWRLLTRRLRDHTAMGATRGGSRAITARRYQAEILESGCDAATALPPIRLQLEPVIDFAIWIRDRRANDR